MGSTKLPDQKLLERLRDHPEQGMELLFKQYYGMVYQTVFRLVHSEAACKDLCQETFLEIWKRRKKLRINTSLQAYLARTAVNKTLNYIRDNRKHLSNPPTIDTPELAPDPARSLGAGELQEKINAAIDGLPERCRLVFVLSRFEDLSYQEIADNLGISTKTVENQIVKALSILRTALKPYLKEE